jgi:DNA-binding response OmpR family regulator
VPTLLLADGSPIIQRVVELTFSAENIRVVTVTDGDDAIARIATERPDIVLADIATPTRSGYDICAFIKQRPDLGGMPVLLLAGAFEPVDDARAQQVGCNGIIVKPFEPQHVVARVRELLGGAHREATYVSGVPRPLERLAPRSAPASGGPAASDGVGGDHAAVARTESSGATSVDDSVEEYFQRLDAAMAARRESLAMTSEDSLSADGLPTLDSLLGEFPGESPAGTPVSPLPSPAHVMPPPVEPPDATPTLSPAAHGPTDWQSDAPRSGTTSNPIAEAFTALLAVELGEPGAQAVRLTTAPSEPIVTEALVEEVTRQVAQRLGPDALNRVVADIVSEVAERLVREEIGRIRQAEKPKSQIPKPKAQEG